MQVAQFLTKQLALWGVQRIYGVAGDAILPWLNALGKQHQIRFISCRHESAAAMMASAEAKCTGRPAVCTATSGPGTVNLLNGLADAQTDRVPVIAITGQVETYKLGGGCKQVLSQEGLLQPISHYTTTVASPEAIGGVLHKAFVSAMQRKGVGHLAVCKDIFTRTTGNAVVSELPRTSPAVRADRVEVEQAAELLRLAKKPLLLLGAGVRHVKEACRELAEKLGAGILLTLGAKGTIAESHPLVLGGLGEGGSKAALDALAQADALMILGAAWFPRSYVPQGLTIVQVDNNPESIHAEPHLLSVIADVDEVLPVWLRRLDDRPVNRDWVSRVEQWNRQFWEEIEQRVQQQPEELVKPETLMARLERHLRDDAIVALDTGEHTLWFNRAFRAVRQIPLFSGKWRTMGYALPAAIAAKLVDPDKQVVAVIGDGGLQMNLAELMTVVEQRVAFPIIVVNNGSLGLEEWNMIQNGWTPFATRLHNPDFALLAQSCGIRAKTVHTAGELDEALAEACHADEPILLNVHVTLPTLTDRKGEIPFQAQA
jgi:pyruvate oxidase